MAMVPTDHGPRVAAGEATDDLATDATNLARGSGIVLIGGVVDRALRWVIKWFLSGALGPVGLGLYETAVTLSATITAFSPLGLDTGVVLFAARYRKSGERDRLKGTLIVGTIISAVMGVVAGGALFSAARWGPWWADSPQIAGTLQGVSPAIVLWTPLLFAVGALRAVKDMRRSAIAFQVVLPVTLLAGSLVAVGLAGFDVPGALGAFALAYGVGLALAVAFAWRHYGRLLRNRSVRPRLEPGLLLGFSIPQSLTAAAFRLNMRMDVLMLAWLGAMSDVGLYTVAASLAAIGSMPANSITAMFNPVIAELVYMGETERLNQLLKVVTRWLVVIAVPAYLVLFTIPGVVLRIYDEAYASAALPMLLLISGQVVNTACAPTMRLIPMSGHAMLNLANGVVALLLNITLNYFLIPEYGALGAAMATGGTLAAWSLWRVGEVWFMLRCFPFDLRTGGLLALAAGGGAGIVFFIGDVWVRAGAAAGLIALFLAVAWFFVRTPEDDVVLGKIRGRLLRMVGG